MYAANISMLCGPILRMTNSAAVVLPERSHAVIGARSATAGQGSVEKQIKAGLVPPVLVRNEPPARTPITTRMKELNVPAVSIAVIHNGKLEWAGAFGTRDDKGSPVTVDSLF